jgi:endonuclease/exonuclease/phosphatase family metal-dependent hydrolase
LCEVENATVLHQLVAYKPLSTYGYKAIHYESPDARGIDVALLYQPSFFSPIKSTPIPVQFADGTYSRDILYVKGLLADTDTLHVMVCHAPSRRGGDKAEVRRKHAMQLVRHVVDSVVAVSPQAAVLVMGDFNDTPSDESILHTLGAVPLAQTSDSTRLVNIMPHQGGTYKYKAEWSLFDQFMVSPELLQGDGWVVEDKRGYIFKDDFLLETDATHMGYKPYRTYLGPRYIGGYSDHLPIFLRLQVSQQKK